MSRRRQLLRGGRKGAQLVANVGDIAYKAPNGKIMVVAQDLWDASLGTPVGVVVIPSGFAPDNGLARIVSLRWGSISSTSSTSEVNTYWCLTTSDTSLTNYSSVVTTNNAGGSSTNSYGYLPSDRFAGTTSYVDAEAKYAGSSPYIPSPYLGDIPNPAYYDLPMSNMLSDFNGKGNTDVIVAYGTGYRAANAAKNYKASGAEEIEWYLPAMGELGYLMVRYNKIQAALTKVGGSQFAASHNYWSSTEFLSGYACVMASMAGTVGSHAQTNTAVVRPYAMLDF